MGSQGCWLRQRTSIFAITGLRQRVSIFTVNAVANGSLGWWGSRKGWDSKGGIKSWSNWVLEMMKHKYLIYHLSAIHLSIIYVFYLFTSYICICPSIIYYQSLFATIFYSHAFFIFYLPVYLIFVISSIYICIYKPIITYIYWSLHCVFISWITIQYVSLLHLPIHPLAVISNISRL